MVDVDRRDAQPLELEGPAAGDRVHLDERHAVVGQFQKVGPDPPVEHVEAQRFLHRLAGMEGDGSQRQPGHVFQEDRQRGDVVHVRMGQDDVADGGLLGRSLIKANGPGVKGDAAVDDK